MSKRIVALLICFCFILEQTGFAQMAPPFVMPAYLSGLPRGTDVFRPVQLRSIEFDPANDNVQLVLDKGDARSLSPSRLEADSRALFRYFQIGLALPNSMIWVNLRPDSPGTVIDPYLENTDLGRVLLEADLQLKKDLARFTNPDTAEGRKYWDKLYAKAEQVFASEDIEIPTITRPWIVPGEIIVRASEKGAFIYKATLKVMLEQDYLKDAPSIATADPRQKELNSYSSQLIREFIIPKLTRDVNSSKRYASLRQVYYSLILAQWYKTKHPVSDSRDLSGLRSQAPWSKDTYYQAYRRSFQAGEYNKQERVGAAGGVTIRQYFSGGIVIANQPGTALEIPSVLGGGSWANDPSLVRLTVDTNGNTPPLQPRNGGGNLDGGKVYEYIKNTEKLDIVEIDISDEALIDKAIKDTIEAIRKGKVVAFTFPGIVKFGVEFGEQWLPEFYNPVADDFLMLSQQLHYAFSPGPQYIISSPIHEVLKNAFAWGNKKDFTLPVYLYMPLDGNNKMKSVAVYDNAKKQKGTPVRGGVAISDISWIGGFGTGKEGIRNEGWGYTEEALGDFGFKITVSVLEKNLKERTNAQDIAEIDIYKDDVDDGDPAHANNPEYAVWINKVVGAVRARKPIALHYRSMPGNEDWKSDYTATMFDMFYLSGRLKKEFGFDYEDDIGLPVMELLRRAFAYKDGVNFDQNVYLFLELNKRSKMERLEVYDTKESREIDEDNRFLQEKARLLGESNGMRDIEKSWDYKEEEVAGGFKASVARPYDPEIAGMVLKDEEEKNGMVTRPALEQLKECIAALKNRRENGIYQQGAVMSVPAGKDVIFIGDLHARLDNLQAMLRHNDNLDKIKNGQTVLVILGDALHNDREPREMDSSVVMLQFIMDLMIKYPDSVYLTPGNHEYLSGLVNKAGVPQGLLLRYKLLGLYGQEYVNMYKKEFLGNIPLVAVAGTFIGAHGFLPKDATLEEIKAADVSNEYDPIVRQVIWGRRVELVDITDTAAASFTREEVLGSLKSIGKEDAVLIGGHSPKPDDNWHWQFVDGRHHVIFAAKDRFGYAFIHSGKVEFIEVPNARGSGNQEAAGRDGGAGQEKVLLNKTFGFLSHSGPMTEEMLKSKQKEFLSRVDDLILKDTVLTELEYVEPFIYAFRDSNQRLAYIHEASLRSFVYRLARNSYDAVATFHDKEYLENNGHVSPSIPAMGIVKFTASWTTKNNKEALQIKIEDSGAGKYAADTQRKLFMETLYRHLYFGGGGLDNKIIHLGDSETGAPALLTHLWEKAGVSQGEFYDLKHGKDGWGTIVTIWLPKECFKTTAAGRDGGAGKFPEKGIFDTSLTADQVNLLTDKVVMSRAENSGKVSLSKVSHWDRTDTSLSRIDEDFGDFFREGGIRAHIVAMAQQNKDKTLTILDWGCGNGAALGEIADALKEEKIRNVRLVGFGNMYFQKWKEVAAKGVDLILDDSAAIDDYFPSTKIDLIVSFWGLNHLYRGVKNPQEKRRLMQDYLRQLHALLSPAGQIVTTTYLPDVDFAEIAVFLKEQGLFDYDLPGGGSAGILLSKIIQDGGSEAPGGIDFRNMPMSGRQGRVPVLLSELQQLAARSKITDLDREWAGIQQEIQTREMPYDRIKEYIAVCVTRADAGKDLDKAVCCILNILRIEEAQALPTRAGLKELLICLG